LPREDGTEDWVRWKICPWHDPAGAVGGIIIFSEVITDRKRAEETRVQDARLAEADKLWSELLANVTHELRTPLTLTASPVETLLSGEAGPLTEKQAHLLWVIQRNAAKLCALVDDLLACARLEAGEVYLK
jgi:K+-sensing histidine kinase KdpD